MRTKPYTEQATLPELRRMKHWADRGLPPRSISIVLHDEFGTTRTPDTVRTMMRRYHGWRGLSRGAPFGGSR